MISEKPVAAEHVVQVVSAYPDTVVVQQPPKLHPAKTRHVRAEILHQGHEEGLTLLTAAAALAPVVRLLAVAERPAVRLYSGDFPSPAAVLRASSADSVASKFFFKSMA